MKLKIDSHTITLYREDGDPKFYGVTNAAGESGLLHYLKNELNSRGFHLIKKRMWKDGHMVDEMQQYLRTDKARPDVPNVFIWNGSWAIRGAEQDWNEGRVTLEMDFDVFEKNNSTDQRLQARELIAAMPSIAA